MLLILLLLVFRTIHSYREILGTREMGNWTQVVLSFHQPQAPRNIQKLFDAVPALQQMELSFGQQRWDPEAWGLQPPGLEKPMGVYFRLQHKDDVGVDWKRLLGGLGGMFCASLSLLTEADLIMTKQNGLVVIEGLLPREAVCTENLTPWSKLLPCGSGNAGLGTLLIPRFIYNSKYTVHHPDSVGTI